MNLTLDLKACGQHPDLGKAIAVAVLTVLPPEVAEKAVKQWRESSARLGKLEESERSAREEWLRGQREFLA
jgi:hypothetical protein